MDELTSHDEQAIRDQLGRARETLDALVRELRALDRNLEELGADRQRYRLLHEVCSGLEELAAAGGASLFWGDDPAEGEAHVRRVRSRVDVFEKRLSEIEDQRQAVIESIQEQEEASELLADDLLELEHQKELRKQDWAIEREASAVPAGPSVMPWTRGGEDDERFRRTLVAALLLSVLLGLLFPWIDLPLPERWEPVDVPERLARLIREELPPPPPPPAREQTKPEQAEPEPELAKEPTPEAAPQQTAKKRSPSKGILAFREKFSGLAENRPAARLGAQARIRRSGEAAAGRPERSMVAASAPGSSGGINVAALSRDVGGGGGDQIAGVEVARVTSSIGSGGEAERPLSQGPGPARTDEEIQIVFDRHKAALYRLYNRELRRDPTLKGQMVLRIRIEPDGSVSLCELQSSDMKAPQLAAQVLERVKGFDFGAKEGVPTITILYPIDFLPAT